MSALLSKKDVANVMESLRPAIVDFMTRNCKRVALAISVLDPATEDVLYEEKIGDPATWENPYDEYAHRKALVSGACNTDSEVVGMIAPFLYDTGDIPFPGGVNVHGLAIGCSGVEPHYDQMFARWIGEGCRAISIQRFKKEVVEPGLTAIP